MALRYLTDAANDTQASESPPRPGPPLLLSESTGLPGIGLQEFANFTPSPCFQHQDLVFGSKARGRQKTLRSLPGLPHDPPADRQ
jgi:hypothetical protein